MVADGTALVTAGLLLTLDRVRVGSLFCIGVVAFFLLQRPIRSGVAPGDRSASRARISNGLVKLDEPTVANSRDDRDCIAGGSFLLHVLESDSSLLARSAGEGVRG